MAVVTGAAGSAGEAALLLARARVVLTDPTRPVHDGRGWGPAHPRHDVTDLEATRMVELTALDRLGRLDVG